MKHLFLIICFLISISGKAQTILGSSTIPSNPTDADTVYLVVDLAFNSGDCIFHHSNVSTGGFMTIDLYHCTGMLTVICYATDTILLGVLPAGVYQSQVNVYTAPYTGPDACSSFTQDNQDMIQFQVDLSNGIKDADLINPTLVYHSQTQSFSILNSSQKFEVNLFSAEGKVVFQSQVDSGFKIDGLAKGIYFYSLKGGNGVVLKGKVGVE